MANQNEVWENVPFTLSIEKPNTKNPKVRNSIPLKLSVSVIS